MKIVVGHLYPDYLNIYADHELEVRSVSIGEPVQPGEHDLLYVGGGQDREQALVAQDLVTKADGVRESVSEGAALLAVCAVRFCLGSTIIKRVGTAGSLHACA